MTLSKAIFIPHGDGDNAMYDSEPFGSAKGKLREGSKAIAKQSATL